MGKKNRSLPQLTGTKRGSQHRDDWQASQYDPGFTARKRRRKQSLPVAWILVSFVLIGLMFLVTSPLWMPLIRFVVPDRYIATYAPEWAAEMILVSEGIDAVLPADNVNTEGADDLLSLAPTEAMGTQPDNNGNALAGQSTQPTEVPFTPTALPTPAYLYSNPEDELEEGGEADFSTADVHLTGFTHTYQGWNNCGPASITTLLSYWGFETTQTDAVNYLKTDPEDRNVRPDELAAYVESLGYGATVRVDGDLGLLKSLLEAGFPVMVEKGFDPEPDRLGWMGHYLVLTGYSDTAEEFYSMDSYLGPNRTIKYATLDKFWRHFNRLYIVPYRPDQEELLASLIGDDWDDTTMWNNAAATARRELNFDSEDPFGWYNLGASFMELGRIQEAETAFDQAREIGIPWRMLWYQYEPYETYLEVGRYEDVIRLADNVIANNVYSEEAYYFKGLAFEEQGNTSAARNQFNNALKYNRNYAAAQNALTALEAGQ